MKAAEIPVGTPVKVEHYKKNCAGGDYYYRNGVVIANKSRQGDEVVVIEWDDDFTVQAANVNDVERV